MGPVSMPLKYLLSKVPTDKLSPLLSGYSNAEIAIDEVIVRAICAAFGGNCGYPDHTMGRWVDDIWVRKTSVGTKDNRTIWLEDASPEEIDTRYYHADGSPKSRESIRAEEEAEDAARLALQQSQGLTIEYCTVPAAIYTGTYSGVGIGDYKHMP